MPDFIDPEDTITLRDLDDDFAAADLENLISEISTWSLQDKTVSPFQLLLYKIIV